MSLGFGDRVGSRCEPGRDDLAYAHREVLLHGAPAPSWSNVLVAEDSAEPTLRPHGKVEHRGDPSSGGILAQATSARVSMDVLNVQDSRLADGLEVLREVGRKQHGAVLELSAAGDVARVAGHARALLVETPEAHTLDVENLGFELAEVPDPRGPPTSAPRHDLEQEPCGLELKLAARGLLSRASLRSSRVVLLEAGNRSGWLDSSPAPNGPHTGTSGDPLSSSANPAPSG